MQHNKRVLALAVTTALQGLLFTDCESNHCSVCGEVYVCSYVKYPDVPIFIVVKTCVTQCKGVACQCNLMAFGQQ